MKLVDVGFGVIRNEEECITGWAKSMLHFCKKVYCLLDPDTSDKTYNILKYNFPQIEIMFQDRSMGDSDNKTKGPKEILIMHKMLEWAVNTLVKKGQIFMLLSGDERFDPAEFPGIEYEINYMITEGFNGINFATNMITFAPRDPTKYINYLAWFDKLFQCRFQRKTKDWILDGKTNRSMNWSLPVFDSRFHFFHYCWMKKSREPYSYWRDRKHFAQIPLLPFINPIEEWRDMSMLDNNGEIIK